MVHASRLMRGPRGTRYLLMVQPMTALTLVMGFYELSARDQKSDGKSDAITSLGDD